MKTAGWLVVILGFGALGCGDGTGVDDFLGSYALALVNGAAPPVQISSHVLFGESCHVDEMPGGSITFRDGGRYSRVTVQRLRCEGGQPQTFAPATQEGSWTRVGSTLTILPDVAIGEVVVTGTIGTDVVTMVEVQAGAQNRAFTYER